MAAAPMPSPATTATQPSSPSGPSMSSSQADPSMVMLSQIAQAASRLAQQNPLLSSGCQKIAEGAQEAMTALVVQPSPPQTSQNPRY